MEEIQLMLARSADAVSSGNFKDAYFCYLDIIDAAAIELRKVKFIANGAYLCVLNLLQTAVARALEVAITSTTTATLISITRSSVVYAQDILSRQNAAIAAISEPPAVPRKTSLSRHSDRITAGQTKTVTMLTEQLRATASDICSVEQQQQQLSSPIFSRVTTYASRSTPPANSPTASPPPPRTTTVLAPSLPPKPTRRPPPPVVAPTPPSRSPVLGFTEQGTMPSIGGGASNTTNSLHPLSTIPGTSSLKKSSDHASRPHSLPAQSMHVGGRESPPQSKPPLPPKPARLYRKLQDIKTEEHLLDEEDSDEDEDEDEDDDLEAHVFSPTLHRRASSPSIAIPNPTRRPGTPLSVPTSPTLSPSSISSSISSADRSRSYTLPQYASLSQANAFITVIPDGSVDPTNLVEAERISGDNDDQLDQKTYGPSDHIPLIPVTPLRTTHRTLVEKEKTCSAKLAETKQKLQERTLELQHGDDTKPKSDRQEDDVDTQTLQENLTKYTSMISNVMATITKVRELLYRSASVTSILEFPAYLVAYQLTLVESAVFLEIPPSALLTHSPKTPHRSITASTDFFNYLTRMIEYSVLFPPEASGRAQCMHYWVKVAVKLHELENFQTLKAVLSALGTPPIKRLKRTWSFVPRKSMHKLETLSELMSEARNYGKYREMMASLNAGTMMLSPPAVSPVYPTSAPSGKLDMLSLNGMSSSLSNLGFRTKEAARRPMVPFLGTFIMDITYLLAAVKKSNNSAPPISSQIPATSSLREKSGSTGSPSINTQFAPEDDVRIQDLLMALTAYQSDRQIGANITHQSSYEEEEDDVSGNGLRPTQQLIFHYLLTRPWVPERMVDELSTIREPPKNKNLSTSGSTRQSAGGSTHSWPGLGGTGGGSGSMVGGGSVYSQISTTSTIQRGSTGSNSGDGGHNGSGGSSRPTSVDE
ncbi:hypothetical protein BGZ54_008565 [Gamsiella multidivaricata]|nr:hypothetical protein BGZ54_008565 [Gamsiella multidivaricata]